MLVKDEADIVEATVRHLLWHVDEVIVADNLSADGTLEILQRLPVELRIDGEVGYYQDRKTTALAMEALERGHQWVVPCDADEIWHHGEPGLALRDFFAGIGPDVQMVSAGVWNHLATALDPPAATVCPDCGGTARRVEGTWSRPGSACRTCGGSWTGEPNPVRRIGWHQRFPLMRKVACRLRPDLRIGMGNHEAFTSGTGLTISALNVRHFSWRTEEQYLRKMLNGRAAYAATDLDPMYGVGWRMWDGKPDEAIRESFREHFFSRNPEADDTLIYDPAPLRVGG
jgi:glycosyltransferase involved in cell wall biosynthesis